MINEILLSLKEFITERTDEAQYTALLVASQLQCGFKKSTDSSMAHFLNVILDLMTKRFNLTRQRLEYDMGQFVIAQLASRYSQIFAEAEHPRDLLKKLSAVHQMIMESNGNNCSPPRFMLLEQNLYEMLLSFESDRMNFCHLIEGMIVGLGNYFDINTEVRQIACQQNNEPYCIYSIHFSSLQVSAEKQLVAAGP